MESTRFLAPESRGPSRGFWGLDPGVFLKKPPEPANGLFKNVEFEGARGFSRWVYRVALGVRVDKKAMSGQTDSR